MRALLAHDGGIDGGEAVEEGEVAQLGAREIVEDHQRPGREGAIDVDGKRGEGERLDVGDAVIPVPQATT